MEEKAVSSPGATTADRRRILGLRVPVFWGFLVALVMILAAAIGGGIGGGLTTHKHKSHNKDKNTTSSPLGGTVALSSTTTTTITTTLPPKEQSTTLAGCDGCPDINGKTYTSPEVINGTSQSINLRRQVSAQSFVQLCSTDFPKGSNSNNSNDDQVVQDLNPPLQRDLRAVVDQRCRAVSFVKRLGGICYLKGMDDRYSFRNITSTFSADCTSGLLIEGM
ncbi:hypothetical protein PG988_006068 [Apiospora saccharicola]